MTSARVEQHWGGTVKSHKKTPRYSVAKVTRVDVMRCSHHASVGAAFGVVSPGQVPVGLYDRWQSCPWQDFAYRQGLF